ncbi:MAG: adenine phosphoribosyltransferase [Deltaproteobacteria bacterium]|nr:adenine phosphoribosyltransferase [Deltaproteobacteria bacterium]
MLAADLEFAKKLIRDVPDHPKPGILFKDITPLIGDARAFKICIEQMAADFDLKSPQKFVGIEARGFIFAAALAQRLNAGFVPARKKGKLPYRSFKQSYDLEYGVDEIEMHEDAILKGERVVVVDDLLATGGTAEAAVKLCQKLGADVLGCQFLIELEFLKGRKRLQPLETKSIFKF